MKRIVLSLNFNTKSEKKNLTLYLHYILYVNQTFKRFLK